MPMRRSDRRSDSDDNAARNPIARSSEPLSSHDLRATLMTVRANNAELQQQIQTTEQQITQQKQLYLEAQQRIEATEQQVTQQQQLYLEVQQQHQSTLVLYQTAQTQAESNLKLYNEEKSRSSDLLVKYEQAQLETQRYLTLYNDVQLELKQERRSKAGIKGWETRRKRENERLKQEIGAMALVLRDSLARKDEAINNLEALADRMDRLQFLVDSVDPESATNPTNFLQKIVRIWQAMKDILAE
jgi:chromosome segregation ATPase